MPTQEVERKSAREAASPSMSNAETWRRAADAAAAVHQIRNRLQSIIVEAALLKRGSPAIEQESLSRIAALAQDGAKYLELFAELLPAPKLEGAARFSALGDMLREADVASDATLEDVCIRCRPDALSELLQVLLLQAIPFRGFRPTRLRVGAVGSDQIELVVDLVPVPPKANNAYVTPWLSTQQMVRDLGGMLELHSGEPPCVKLRLPVVSSQSA